MNMITPAAPAAAPVAPASAATLAAPSGANAATAPAATALATLKSDKEFMTRAFGGNKAAAAQLLKAQEAAFPKDQVQSMRSGDHVAVAAPPKATDPAAPSAEPAKAGQGEAPVAPGTHYDFANKNLTDTEAMALNVNVNEAVRSMGLPPEAKGMIQSLDAAINERAGTPMDVAELSSFDLSIEKIWNTPEMLAEGKMLVSKALWRSGAHREWITQSILRAGPQAAAMAFVSLANSERARVIQIADHRKQST